MIDFSQNSYQALRTQMLRRIPDTYDKRDTQPIPTAISPAAYAAEGLYIDLGEVQRQSSPFTATGGALEDWCVLGSISRYPASAAVRLGEFSGADVPVGSRFSTINAQRSIDFTVTAVAANGKCELTADTPGTIGNEYVGAILPVTAIPGLASARITEILVPGSDAEEDEALRARLFLALRDRAFGGNIASYREDILAIDGVGAVQVYPVWAGGGTVKCSILGADGLPAPAALVAIVQRQIDPPEGQGLGLGLAPIGARVTITAPQAEPIAVSARLDLAAGYTPGQVQPGIETALADYLASVRADWSTNISPTSVAYAANVYLSRCVAAIVSVAGVVNAVDVRLNGAARDILLAQTGALQQVPVLGEVTLV